MAEADGGARRREPLLLGISGALIGVVLAVALVAFLGLGGDSPGASGSPAALSSASVAPSLSAAGSPSIAPTAALPPSPEVTIAPATTTPTVVPTPRPTPRPTRTPQPAPTPNTNPAITKFTIPSLVDCTAGAATIPVSWTIRRATGVTLSIDGGLFMSYSGTTNSDNVPFGCDANNRTHTYTLRTTGGTGPAASITKPVKWGAMTIVSFSMGPNAVANCPNTNATVGIDLSYVLRYATGAELERDGLLYATYSGKVVDTTGIAYQCSQMDQEFKLTTTGGYGTAATKTILVRRSLP